MIKGLCPVYIFTLIKQWAEEYLNILCSKRLIAHEFGEKPLWKQIYDTNDLYTNVLILMYISADK